MSRGTFDEAEAQRLLEIVKTTQTAFWSAVGELEKEIGIDIDDTSVDFEGYTVDDLFSKEDDEDEEPSHDDSVKCCPDCERANQFGEVCADCERERQLRIAEGRVDA